MFLFLFFSVPGRDYSLEANNRQTCLFWLQELQKYRRVNSLLRTKVISEESSSVNALTGVSIKYSLNLKFLVSAGKLVLRKFYFTF